MNEIKHVMALTSSTTDVSCAVTAGAVLAERWGAKLTVLHVIDDHHADLEFIAEDKFEELQRNARQGLESALNEIRTAGVVPVMSEVRVGSPFDEISNAMIEHKADLITCGVGYGEGDDPYESGLGIISKRLAHKLPVDIVFVRRASEGSPNKILVATDFSSCSADAMRRALTLASKSQVKTIRVINTYSLPEHHFRTGHSEDEVASTMLAHAEKHGKEWLAKIDTHGVAVEMVYRMGSAADVIVDEANQYAADYLFVGTHGRTASAAVLLGNVAERVIHNAKCTVWAERTDGQAMGFAAAIARLMGIE
ncbi:MAG: universal stress protein [Planctomycetes bacterium]|nr:universal stress protein [Planctomycetota bacterium]